MSVTNSNLEISRSSTHLLSRILYPYENNELMSYNMWRGEEWQKLYWTYSNSTWVLHVYEVADVWSRWRLKMLLRAHRLPARVHSDVNQRIEKKIFLHKLRIQKKLENIENGFEKEEHCWRYIPGYDSSWIGGSPMGYSDIASKKKHQLGENADTI